MKTRPNDADAVRCAGYCETPSLVQFLSPGYSRPRGRFAVILGMPVAANSENYWLRRSSPNCLANRLAIIAILMKYPG